MKEKNSKMYILVKESVPFGFAINSVGHASLACYIKFQNDPIMKEWLAISFRKVTCVVSDEIFEKAKGRPEDHVIITESRLKNIEIAIAFKPAKDFNEFFSKLKII